MESVPKFWLFIPSKISWGKNVDKFMIESWLSLRRRGAFEGIHLIPMKMIAITIREPLLLFQDPAMTSITSLSLYSKHHNPHRKYHLTKLTPMDGQAIDAQEVPMCSGLQTKNPQREKSMQKSPENTIIKDANPPKIPTRFSSDTST